MVIMTCICPKDKSLCGVVEINYRHCLAHFRFTRNCLSFVKYRLFFLNTKAMLNVYIA